MTYRRMEGFDGCTSRANLATSRGLTFTDSTTGILYSTAGGRNGGGALYIDSTSSPNTTARTVNVPPSNGPNTTFSNSSDAVVGLAFKIKRGTFNPVTGTAQATLFQFETGLGAEMANVRLYKSGSEWRIGYYTGTTLRYSARFPGAVGDHYYPADDTWYYLEVKVSDFTTTASSVVTIRVDGATIGTSTSIITTTSGLSFNWITLNKGATVSSLMASGQELWFDDFWFGVLSGNHPNDFLGDVSVRCLEFQEVGTYDEWARSAGSETLPLVQDSDPDGDITYIYSDTVGHRVTFKLGSWPGNIVPGSNVHWIHPTFVVKNVASSTKKVQEYYVNPEEVVDEAGTTLSSWNFVPGAAYAWYPHYQTVDTTLTEPNRVFPTDGGTITLREITEVFEYGLILN